MIINKLNKLFQMRSDKPNSNWLDNEWYVVPDNSELFEKIVKLYPRFDFVTNEFGELIDVIEIAKTEQEIIEDRIKDIDLELASIDAQGVTRHLENQIEASETYNTIYESTRKLIDRKNELREERKSLVGGNANAKNNVNE